MTLIIGDIHGCYDELQALLDASGIADDEPIIALGDLLDRGPQPQAVLDFFRDTPNASSIRGNHDQAHINAYYGTSKPRLAQLLTRWYLGGNYRAAVNYLQTLPRSMELDDAVLVHAYYEPGVALEDQVPEVALGLKEGDKRLTTRYERPWFDLYDGEKPIIVGHKDYTSMEKPFIIAGRVYGIDTRCVFGGALTGLLLPQWTFVRVKASRNHYAKLRRAHDLD